MELELNPYLSTFDPPWPNTNFEVPGSRVYVAIDIDSFKFKRLAKLEGYFKIKYKATIDDNIVDRVYDARSLWEDAMQEHICHTVTILTDDPDEGIYCGFCFQNDANYFRLLGRLKDGDGFTETCRKALISLKL